MDKVAAYRILSTALEKHRQLGFERLLSTIGKTSSEEFRELDGTLYTVAVTPSWADSRHKSIVVWGRIDNSSTFHFSPLEERIVVSKPG
jgi:predicted heme/steroid binding protein